MKIMSNNYTMVDAGYGLGKSVGVSEETIEFITRAMEAVEFVGKLSGMDKKSAVFAMAKGVIDNFDEIQDALSKIVDLVKAIYNQTKQFIKEIFD